jgi:hypothetical protein
MSDESLKQILIGVALMAIVIALLLVTFAPAMGQILEKGSEYFTPDEFEDSGQSISKPTGILSSDSPDTAIYKLFSSFDPSYYNETSGSTVYFNQFMIDLKGNSYSADEISDSISRGIADFSDSSYKLSQPCTSSLSGSISFSGGCWSDSLDFAPGACSIYYNSAAFDGNVKIRVVWYLSGSNVRSAIAVCDG